VSRTLASTVDERDMNIAPLGTFIQDKIERNRYSVMSEQSATVFSLYNTKKACSIPHKCCVYYCIRLTSTRATTDCGTMLVPFPSLAQVP